MSYNQNSFRALPVVTRNIILLCVIMFAGTWILESQGIIDLNRPLALHNINTEYFRPHQLVTYMFMHGGIGHIFFNMFALFMFGRILETVWGPKRFLTFFLITGIGAGLIQLAISHYELTKTSQAIDAYTVAPSPDSFYNLLDKKFGEYMSDDRDNLDDPSKPTFKEAVTQFIHQWRTTPAEAKAYAEESVQIANDLYTNKLNTPTLGASGAIFGILMAFGLLFPDIELIMLFLPIPIKAKYAVILYAGIELFMGVANFSWDNVAHFAHLGGALFGFILVKLWHKRSGQL